jgi:hypothetical protein
VRNFTAYGREAVVAANSHARSGRTAILPTNFSVEHKAMNALLAAAAVALALLGANHCGDQCKEYKYCMEINKGKRSMKSVYPGGKMLTVEEYCSEVVGPEER